jgi:hypothetical protein
MAHIMPSINASISEIESRISNYIPKAAERLEKVGEQAGKKVGKSTVDGVAVGAKTASPSKDAIKTGEDIGKGLEIGLESRKDEVAAAGTSLGKVATQSVSRGSRTTQPITPGEQYNIQKTQGGIPISQVARNVPVSPEITAKAAENARVMQTSTERLRGLDRNIMGASFAISSLSGIASMSGGALGNITEQELKYLQATLGAIDLNSDPKVLRENIKRLREDYNRVVHGQPVAPGAPSAAPASTTQPAAPAATRTPPGQRPPLESFFAPR